MELKQKAAKQASSPGPNVCFPYPKTEILIPPYIMGLGSRVFDPANR